MRFIDPKDILEATGGGLNIILSYYPQAEKAVKKQGEKFKVRDSEKPKAAA